MTTAIVFNQPEPGKPDSEDVLHEVAFVESSLTALGHTTVRIPAEGGLEGMHRIIQQLRECEAHVIFNLVESLGDCARLHPAAAALFDIGGIPFTGSSYEALHLSTDKAACKSIMQTSGIPTPAWALYPAADTETIWRDVAARTACIAKPLWEDASIGITDDSVFLSPEALRTGLPIMHNQYGTLLVERFAHGREFNVSIIEGNDGTPRALPVAEMCYRDWPEGKPQIVNYQAKWDPASFEFNNTIREFPDEPKLMASIQSVALASWHAFGLRGYARIDIRLDGSGTPLVMEINANPCISPDSGFIATALKAGLTPEALVGGIVEAALAHGKRICLTQ